MEIVKLLETKLKNDLPGSKIQFEMLPKSRLKDMDKSADTARKSAVLLMLYEKNKKPHILLIVRATGKNVHSGQISFPGGKYEEYDNNLINTALREANEEVGVDSGNIKILGELSSVFIPVSNFVVYPFVAYHAGSLNLKSNPKEVSELIEAPLDSLLDAKNKGMSTIEVRGELIDAPVFNIKNKKIWGATAMIINEFIHVLS